MNKKKILSLIMALVLLVGMFTPLTVLADAHKTKVRIHKILMEEHNWNAKKVTITTTTGVAPNQTSTSESKVIITKQEKVNEETVTKYYYASDQTTALPEDNKFVKALKGETLGTGETGSVENVFPGWSGLDGTEFKGQELDIAKYFGDGSKAIDGVAFRIYEVYTGSEANPAGYTLGSELITQHKLATNDLEATKYYKLVQVDGKDFVTTANGGVAEAILPDGTYRVVEDKAKSTYKGPNGETLTGMKAVPFDLVLPVGKPDGTGDYSVADPLNLYPKNKEEKIKFDKNFAKDNGLEAITDPNVLKDVGAVMDNYDKEKANAEAQIGKEIKYEAKAELPKGSVFTHLDLADSMDNGLEYDATKGVTVTVSPELTNALVANTDYTVTTVGNGFSIKFNQTGLDKLNKKAEETDVSITFTYSAKVTAAAVVDKPMDNHATFTYNHEPPKPSSDKLTPVNKEINVTKTWADGTAPTDITVKYVLLDENDKALADVTFKNATTIVDEGDHQTTDLGHGFKFTRTGNYAGTFKGLEEGKNYKVKEIVNGYEPGYTIATDTATVTVNNTKTPESITPTPPQVTVGGKKFVKTDKDGNRLAGAEFVIQDQNKVKDAQGQEVNGPNYGKYLKVTSTNSAAYDTAETNYNNAIKAVNDALAKGEISATNKVTIGGEDFTTKDAAMAKVKALQDARDKEFVKANLAYTWVDTTDEATKFYSNGDGQFEVTGLEYGNYRAVETKAPAGFALPTNGGEFAFEVKKGSYEGENTEFKYEPKLADGEKQTYGMQIKNNKVTIPQTGGMGTVIFTVVGVVLMAGAVIAMKKNREEA